MHTLVLVEQDLATVERQLSILVEHQNAHRVRGHHLGPPAVFCPSYRSGGSSTKVITLVEV